MAASFALEPKLGFPEAFIKASPVSATISRLGTVRLDRVSMPVIVSKQQGRINIFIEVSYNESKASQRLVARGPGFRGWKYGNAFYHAIARCERCAVIFTCPADTDKASRLFAEKRAKEVMKRRQCDLLKFQ